METIDLTELLEQAEECFQIQCFKDSEDIDFFAKSYCGETLLHVAAIREKANEIKLLIKKGLDINARGDFLETPLFLVASLKKNETVSLLLKLRADSTIPNHLGELPAID